MARNKAKNSVNKIQKEISNLKEKLKGIELRACHGDADIKQKDEDILMLKREIYDLEKEANRFAIFVSAIGSDKQKR